MLKKRIIPCLDIKGGRTVKGVQFIDIKDAGNPIVLAKKYVEEGADELVFLDISATNEQRKTLCSLVTKVAEEINIPFTVGGGIHSLNDAQMLLKAGADKISINTSAVKNPFLISEIASQFGSQSVMVAIDAKFTNNQWYVFINGGKVQTQLTTIDWAKQVEQLGAGEILLTSMNNDGTKKGFAIDITNEICSILTIPVIASGGAGNLFHFKEVFEKTNCSAALAASIFHFDEVAIPELKSYLKKQNIMIR